MKHLAEIARIVNRGRDPREKAFEQSKRSSQSRLGRLFDGAVTGAYTSDLAASNEVFGVDPQNTVYATAKSRLKRRLLNSIMLLNLKKAGYSDYSQAQFSAYRSLFIVQTLYLLGGRRIASKIARRSVQFCKKYHLTIPELEFLHQLRTDARIRANFLEFQRHSVRTNELLLDLQAEQTAWMLFDELAILLGKRTRETHEIKLLAENHSQTLETFAQSAQSFNFRTNYYRVKFYALDLNGKFRDIITMCDEALSYFTSMPQFSTSVAVGEFAFRKLDACLKIRDLSKGEEAANLAKSLIKEGSNNWFFIQLHYCFLLLYSQRFQEAYDVVQIVINYPRFSNLPTILQEHWRMIELHVLYAVDLLTEEGGKINRVKPSERLDTLLQVAPTLSQDKQGHKVSLLILHILYLLEIGDFNGIIDRMEALRLYRARYLKAAQFPKTASFFKLLQIMENNSFSYKMVQEKGEKEYQKLLESTENQEEINEGLQILPYDWLWQKILDRLKEYEEKYSRKGV